MSFASLNYVVFLAVVVILYFVLPHRIRWIWLLAASVFFYVTYDPLCLAVLAAVILITYGAGLLLERQNKNADEEKAKKNKKLILVLSLIISIGVLAFFKYTGFAAEVFVTIANALGAAFPMPDFSIIMPIGISFFTFKVISYLMDIYRGKIEAKRHIGKYALYVSFFPQIISGPIERPETLLKQFDEKKYFSFERMRSALVLILFGLIKKVVIADRMGTLVNTVFNNPGEYTGVPVILAILFYAVQLYCDFSGYSDIAIGTCNLMGFDVMKNFDRPYFSQSIGEFWRRWHISLSSWLRDYLYIPLGGSRVTKARWALNVMIVFLISGLWHGSAMTFIVWGGLHGLYQVIGKFTRKPKDALLMKLGASKESFSYKLLATLCTFALASFAWIFFRASTLSDAFTIIGQALSGPMSVGKVTSLGLEVYDVVFAIVMSILLFIVEYIGRNGDLRERLFRQWLPVRWFIYIAMIFIIIMFGIYGDLSGAAFVYGQF